MTDESKIAAERHQAHEAQFIELFKSVILFASEGIKALQICHGGALTVSLAFAGISRGNKIPVPLELVSAYFYFAVGLYLTLIIWILAYLGHAFCQTSGGSKLFG
jgi:hypothetical protein